MILHSESTDARRWFKRLASPMAWTVYVFLPVGGWGLLNGRPVGPLEVAVLAAVWWLWGSKGSLPWGWVLAALVIVKLVAGGGLLADRGFAARYYANERWLPPYERSMDFLGGIRGSGFGVRDSKLGTRIDARLKFGSERSPDLPLYFFNDVGRFNFYQPGQPERDKLPYSVAWEGYVRIDREEPRILYARGAGVFAQVAVDGQMAVKISPGEPVRTNAIPLQRGWHHLVVRLSSPYGASRQFETGQVSGGKDRPFDTGSVFVAPIPNWRVTANRIVRALSVSVDLVLMAMLSWWGLTMAAASYRRARGQQQADESITPGRSKRAILSILWLAVLCDAFIFALPSVGRVGILSGGDDWLSYETLATDIALNGPLMSVGTRLGEGRPFYYQPLYPYFLGACHLVFGDGLFGIYFVQRLLLAVTVFAVWRTTASLFGSSVGRVGLLAGGFFLYAKAGPWSGVLLSEPLFMALISLWAMLLVDTIRRGPSSGRLVLCGVVGGLATLTRSTLLFGWMLALPLLAVSLRPTKRALRSVSLVCGIMIAVVSLATIRNWIISHSFVPITSSFSVNLFLGNSPPASVQVYGTSRSPIYDRLGLDLYTRYVVEYAVQAPGAFIRNLGKKAMFTLGFFDRFPGTGARPGLYAATWILAVVGIAALVWRRQWSPGVSGAAVMLPLAISVSHFAAVVLIFPNVYGDRLILPLYVLLIPYVAVALTPLVAFLSKLEQTSAETLVGAGLVLAIILWRNDSPLLGADVSMACVLLIGIAGLVRGLPRFALAQVWPYGAFMVAVSAAFLLSRTGISAGELRSQMLFLGLVVTFARLATTIRVQAMTVALIFASALTVIGVAVFGGASAVASEDAGRLTVIALAAAGVAASAGVLVSGRIRWLRLMSALLAGACTTTALLFVLGGPTPTSLSTVELRVWNWPAAALMLKDHPWFGIGPGMYSTAYSAYQAFGSGTGASSGVLQAAAELGLIGVSCYLALWVRALWVSFAQVDVGRAAPFAAALHGALIAFFLCSQFGVSAARPEDGFRLLLLAGVMFGLVEALRALSNTPDRLRL